MEGKQVSCSKALRMLSIFERLCKGMAIEKQAEARRFGVNEKSIQRDIEDLRLYFYEHYLGDRAEPIEVIYDKRRKSFLLNHDHHVWLTNQEVLVLAKILLECRAFPKAELDSLLCKLAVHCEPKERKHIEKVIRNERFHYIPVSHNQPLFQKIWDFSWAMREQRIIKILYKRIGHEEWTERLVKPQGIVFSEYYFYLIAYIDGFDYDFPAIYRLDRIKDYTVMEEKFSIPEEQRFEEGEFRKRVQFMTTGHLVKIQFRFWGHSLEAVLDRLPTARVMHTEGNVATIEAEVFGQGVKMWLLSQGEYLEVIKPESFREEMKQTVERMYALYCEASK
jgi:predicted DNA-binding transcriptional regulator YafY